MKPTQQNVRYMLRESNAIEGVYGTDAVKHAHNAWKLLMRFDKLNIMMIKEAHKLLMVNQPLEHKYRGEWRPIPVWIGGEKKSDPPLVIDQKMRAWVNKTNTVDRNFDPVTLHIAFEDIHPFVDGNGRIGRILLNWHLIKRNKAPLLVYTEADKKTYYRLFSSYRAKEMKALFDMLPDIVERFNQNDKDITHA